MITGDDSRKNFARACQAFAKAFSENRLPSDARLRIIGAHSNDFSQRVLDCLKDYPDVQLGREVVVEGFMDDDAMANAMANAMATIFPSLYEGLGLPIIESYAAGTACISSNNSSCAEFNIPECQFDPYSIEDIADKIEAIYRTPKLREKCLAAGRKLIQECSWDRTAEKVVQTLSTFRFDKASRIAMIGCVPPAESGIAVYNQHIAEASTGEIDVFGDDRSVHQFYSHMQNFSSCKNILPVCAFDDAARMRNYTAHVCVLGNSFHNLHALQFAVNRRDLKNRWLYLHEGELKWLVKAYCEAEHLDVATLNLAAYGKRSGEFLGVRTIQLLTGIKNILVNTHECEAMVKRELHDVSGLCVKRLFHPLGSGVVQCQPTAEFSRQLQDAASAKSLLVGSFGIPNDFYKGTDTLIRAVKTCRKTLPNLKLVLGGYGVKWYLKEHPEFQNCQSWLHAFESPSDDELALLMKSVHLGVQMRPRSHGEASGTIAQLIGFKKPIITTLGFARDYQEIRQREVPAEVDAEMLSKVILESLTTKRPCTPSDSSLNHYTFTSFVILFKAAVNS